jgi:hypothetical protein
VKGGDNTTVILAVAFKIDVAVVRRAVVSVDKVEVLGETAPVRVSN